MWVVYLHLLLVNLVLATSIESSCVEAPEGCYCSNMMKCVTCDNLALQEIPKSLKTDFYTTHLILSENNIRKITRYAFKDLGLVNLTSLGMWSCKIETIEENGLSGLPSLKILNLSENSLKTLDADTFKENVNIEWINLRHNQIETLGHGIFSNLPNLHIVDLAYNRIVQISVKTFINVPKLRVLELKGNELVNLKIECLSAITSLAILTLNNNPWRCDCLLRPLRDWVVDKMNPNNEEFFQLYSLYDKEEDDVEHLKCKEPENKNGKIWIELSSSEFACTPRIIYVSSIRKVQTSDNITIACQADGDPLPEVNWLLNGEAINETNDYYRGSKHYITQNNNESSKWVNLTVVNADPADSGDHVCVARNAAGVEQRNLTIKVSNDKDNEVGARINAAWIVLIVLVIAAITVGAITYWRRKATIVAAVQEILEQPSVGGYSRMQLVHT